MDPTLVIIAAGAALAGFAQGVSGFAFALVALSVWAWGIDSRLAAVLAVFGSLVGQTVALPFIWRGFNLRRALPMIAGGLLGIPIGVQLVGFADPNMFRLGLGLFLIGYCSALLLLRSEQRINRGGRLADAVVGWIGGVMGGLAGLSGAIPTLWTTLRGLDKDEQRGMLQGFNMSVQITTLAVYAVTGTLTADMGPALATTVLSVVPFTVCGVLIFRRLSTASFRRLVLMLLAVSGAVLVWGAAALWQ